MSQVYKVVPFKFHARWVFCWVDRNQYEIRVTTFDNRPYYQILLVFAG